MSHPIPTVGAVARMTTFRFTAEPDAEGAAAFRRHMGARRFAYNECRRAVVAAPAAKRVDPATVVPRSGYSLINWFNAWKKTEAAGRRFAVDSQGCAELVDLGLFWRNEVCAQVFEEAAVDLGRALAAFSASKKGQRKGARVGFPRAKKKGSAPGTFRLRSKVSPSGTPSIRLGEVGAWLWRDMALKDRTFICAAWSRTGTSMRPSTSPPGRTPSVSRHLGPRTPKQGAGSTMPVERAALAIRSLMVKLLSQRPASMWAKKQEPARCWPRQSEPDAREGRCAAFLSAHASIGPGHDRHEVVLGVPGLGQGAVGPLQAADAEGVHRQAILGVGPERPQADPGEADRPRLHGLLE